MYSYFQNAIACKILRFVYYFASNSSDFVLIAIAVDRYRKVCQPFKRQITAKMTKLIDIVTVCFISLSISWPSFLFSYIYAVAENVHFATWCCNSIELFLLELVSISVEMVGGEWVTVSDCCDIAENRNRLSWNNFLPIYTILQEKK
jgi:hypothetical protein